VFALFVILEAAALLIAVYLTFPGLFARLKLAKAPAPEQWMVIERADGSLEAWRIGVELPINSVVSDYGPYTADEIATMREQN
jgi:hypothetical protein